MNRILVLLAGTSGLPSPLLIDLAIKGAVVLVLAFGVAGFLRRDSAATRHLVWLVAIVAMLSVSLLSPLLPQWRILPQWVSVSTLQEQSRRVDLQNTRNDAPFLNVSPHSPQIDEHSVAVIAEPVLPPLRRPGIATPDSR